MTLAEFMKERDLDDEAMAALIGKASAHAVKKWKYGERIPRPDALARISHATGGLVGPADFYALPSAEQGVDASSEPVASAA